MSILIKGVEMPRSCANCFISAGDCDLWEGFSSKTKKRHHDCPLVEIKSPHGRLIDADELRARMYHEAFETDTDMQRWESGCWIRYKMFERMEEAAPTVLEAEGEG